jgi:hypothetical protein
MFEDAIGLRNLVSRQLFADHETGNFNATTIVTVAFCAYID